MGILRSETMKHGTLVLPIDHAHQFVDLIGSKTKMQFEDMNSRDMQRTYKKYIQRIDEMERILRFLFEELQRVPGAEVQKNQVDDFLENARDLKLDEVEATLKGLYSQFVQFKENNMNLQTEKNQANEETQVVEAALKILLGGGPAPVVTAEVEDFEASAKKPVLGEELGGGRLGYVAGVVPKADELRFARALWRASRGNTFTQFSEIAEPVKDPKTGNVVEKSVFVIYFQGASGPMNQKVIKVCSAFGVNMYQWPADAETAARRLSGLKTTLAEKERALQAYQSFMKMETADLVATGRLTANSKIEEWRLFCIKEKSIYSVLNMCSGDLALCVNVWYPAEEEASIKQLLKEGVDCPEKAFLTPDRGAPKRMPPTYIRTNEYTDGWQEIISTYGIPKYQEANPALLTVVTFPFIFGMMYGDVGHGTLLLLAGLWLCKNSESLRFTQPALFQGRFMVLSMGIFATYAGFLYNDFFSVGLQLFESGFVDKNGNGEFEPTYDITNSGGPGPYPFGVDWAWHGAANELLYMNSLKMKLSVLFGVLQMFVGVLLRWSNSFHEKNMVDFLFECIPMMIFLCCFFGWMDVMILYKWVHPIDAPPSIINSLICMAMGQEDKFPLWDGSVQMAQTLMMYTVCAVPFMLFPKPFILLYRHNQAQAKSGALHEPLLEAEEAPAASGGHGGHAEFEFGEVFIHQIIETIEFVLGTVSHTASYLRIWALSLAHQQLSLVFFQKTLTMGLEMSFPANGIVLYIMFAAWFGITLGVLLGMDVLECFLHTLRLHWVEFQSKFYKADGEKFAPYDIQALVEYQDV